MPNNPPSFRRPLSLPADLHPDVAETLKNHDDAITDLQQAIPSLKSSITAITTSNTSSSSTSSSSSSAAAAAARAASETVVVATPALNVIGMVNDQTGNTSYTTVPADYGAFIILNDASPIAVTLTGPTTVTTPWVASFLNLGAGTATLTPSSGTISSSGSLGAANLSLPSGYAANVAFDGTDFWAETISISGTGGSGVTQIVAGTNVTISPPGGTGVVTVNSTAGGGGVTQLISGSGISLSPPGGTGVVTVTNTGGGGGGYLKGSVAIVVGSQSSPASFTGTATVTGATTSMAASACLPSGASFAFIQESQINLLASVTGANTVTVSLWVPGGGINYGTITVQVVVFP